MATRPSRRRWLVILSLAAHAGVIGVYVVVGMWRIEKVSLERSPIQIASGGMTIEDPGPGLPAGTKPDDPAPRVTDEPVVVDEPVQPRTTPPAPAPTPEHTGGGDASSSMPPGGGGPGGPPGAGQPCVGPDCATAQTTKAQLPPDEPTCPGDPRCPEPEFVSPIEVGKLRLTGETQIMPADVTKTAMARDGKTRVTGVVGFCLDTSGRVTRASTARSTGYPDYDARLLIGVRRWTYRPHMIGKTPIPVCSTVMFAFSMK